MLGLCSRTWMAVPSLYVTVYVSCLIQGENPAVSHSLRSLSRTSCRAAPCIYGTSSVRVQSDECGAASSENETNKRPKSFSSVCLVHLSKCGLMNMCSARRRLSASAFTAGRRCFTRYLFARSNRKNLNLTFPERGFFTCCSSPPRNA